MTRDLDKMTGSFGDTQLQEQERRGCIEAEDPLTFTLAQINRLRRINAPAKNILPLVSDGVAIVEEYHGTPQKQHNPEEVRGILTFFEYISKVMDEINLRELDEDNQKMHMKIKKRMNEIDLGVVSLLDLKLSVQRSKTYEEFMENFYEDIRQIDQKIRDLPTDFSDVGQINDYVRRIARLMGNLSAIVRQQYISIDFYENPENNGSIRNKIIKILRRARGTESEKEVQKVSRSANEYIKKLVHWYRKVEEKKEMIHTEEEKGYLFSYVGNYIFLTVFLTINLAHILGKNPDTFKPEWFEEGNKLLKSIIQIPEDWIY